jgi:hypothetical protein
MSTLTPWPIQVEHIAGGLSASVIHGWHTSRLLKYGGTLYASGTLPARDGDTFGDTGVFYRREAGGAWTPIPTPEPHLYSTLVAPDGHFWASTHRGYDDVVVKRSARPVDARAFDALYQGRNAYMGLGLSPEGGALLLYADHQNMEIGVPNAITAAFYDPATCRWHESHMDTPEGRYGYMGLLVRGRRALAVLNSALRDPQGNPVPPHYTWRHVRLARCDDLTHGEWHMRAWLMPEFGHTLLQDMILAPDGHIYLAYSHLSGSSFEVVDGKPLPHYVARIREDLTADVYATGLDAAATRLFVDSRGGWHVVGRPGGGGNLRLWRLDPAHGFKPVREYELPGTDVMAGYVIHTLRPERFGGEGDGDTVHLMTAGYARDERGQPVSADLWHAWFDLPSQDG